MQSEDADGVSKCPKSNNPSTKLHNKIKRLLDGNMIRLFLPVTGLASLLWFLIRVIPKPSRAGYPCMRVAAPLASTFIIYLTGLFAAGRTVRRSGRQLGHPIEAVAEDLEGMAGASRTRRRGCRGRLPSLADPRLRRARGGPTGGRRAR